MRPTLESLGQWVLDTARMFGASPVTAHKVAAAFVEGIEREWRLADISGEQAREGGGAAK